MITSMNDESVCVFEAHLLIFFLLFVTDCMLGYHCFWNDVYFF